MRTTVLPADWQLPEKILNRLGRTVGRQRAMHADGHLLILLHAPPVPGTPEREPRLFWRDPRGEWRSTWSGSGGDALTNHLVELGARIDVLEEKLEKYEDSGDLFAILRGATPLQRSVRHLHTTLQDAREMLVEDQTVIDARDHAGGLVRAIELLYSETRCALDFEIAEQGETHTRVTHQLNVSAHRLNMLATVFLPLVALTGIFGMNTDATSSAGIVGLGLMLGLIFHMVLTRPRLGGIVK